MRYLNKNFLSFVMGALCLMPMAVFAAPPAPVMAQKVETSRSSSDLSGLVQLVDGEVPLDEDVPPNRRGLYNGYKGYRHHRPNYRRHSDGWWYPKAAFDGIPNPKAVDGRLPTPRDKSANGKDTNGKSKVATGKALPPKHVKWCQKKYRSYRSSDNTFQPNKGERRACRSPFMKAE